MPNDTKPDHAAALEWALGETCIYVYRTGIIGGTRRCGSKDCGPCFARRIVPEIAAMLCGQDAPTGATGGDAK